MVVVPHLRQLTQVGTYLSHLVGEALELIEQGKFLQVPENLLAVAHGVGIVQVAEQDSRDEVTLLAITRDRRHDLVRFRSDAKERSSSFPSAPWTARPLLEQQAEEVTTTFWR